MVATAVLVDLVGYSDMAHLLEDSLGVQATLSLNQQVQGLIGEALTEAGGSPAANTVTTTGDGALLKFDTVSMAVDFAVRLHKCAARHNDRVTEPRAKRIFRVGISTGELATDAATGLPAGMAISRAARLEARADPGGILIDHESWVAELAMKDLFTGPEEIAGKRDEIFEGWRAQIDPDGAKHAAYWTDAKKGDGHNGIGGTDTGLFGLSRRQLMMTAGGVGLVSLGAGFVAWESGLFGPATAANSIAVLPFKNLSNDPEQAYFSDGLSEEVRATLARNPELKVAAPASSDAFREKNVDTKLVGDQLGVAFLLQGSVRRAKEVLRISAELIDIQSGFSSWSQVFDRPMTDVFAVQTEIATVVAQELAVKMISGKGGAGREDGGTDNVDAFDQFLHGQAFLKISSGEATDRAALAEFEKAIALDGKYAAAWAAKSRALSNIANAVTDASQSRDLFDQSIAAAQQAVKFAPKFANAHSALGNALANGKLDVRGATPHFEKSRELGLGDALVLARYAQFAARSGRADSAQAAISRALLLDPLNPIAFRAAATVEYCARRYDQAIANCKKGLMLNPKLGVAHAIVGDSLLAKGRFKEALAEYALEGRQQFALPGIVVAHRALKDETAAAAAFAKLVADFGQTGLYQQAQVLAKRGDAQGAQARLSQARALGDAGLLLLPTDPFLDSLRNEPAFRGLMNAIGFS